MSAPNPAYVQADFDGRVGGVLREIRAARRLRQRDVAAAAAELGLDWTQATVAAIETGRRHVAAVELVALPRILSTSHSAFTCTCSESSELVTLAGLVRRLGYEES